jgi:hypothetical protein
MLCRGLASFVARGIFVLLEDKFQGSQLSEPWRQNKNKIYVKQQQQLPF